MRVVKRQRALLKIVRFPAWRLVVSLLTVCFVFAATSRVVPGVFAQALKPAPAFDLGSINGSRLSSKALEGKVVLVDFWTLGASRASRKFRTGTNCMRDTKRKGLLFWA